MRPPRSSTQRAGGWNSRGPECAVEEAYFKHTPWAPSSSPSSSSPLSRMRGGARNAYAFFNEGPLFCCYGHRTQGDVGTWERIGGKRWIMRSVTGREQMGPHEVNKRNKNIWNNTFKKNIWLWSVRVLRQDKLDCLILLLKRCCLSACKH